MFKMKVFIYIGLFFLSIADSYSTSQDDDISAICKKLKQSSKSTVTDQDLELLQKLSNIADQDNFEAKGRYVLAVRYLKWNPETASDNFLTTVHHWDKLETRRNLLLNKMVEYRDFLILKYEEDIKNSKSKDDIDKIKYKLAKMLLANNADDPGNKRKIRFFEIKKELQATSKAEKINNWYEKHKSKIQR